MTTGMTQQEMTTDFKEDMLGAMFQALPGPAELFVGLSSSQRTDDGVTLETLEDSEPRFAEGYQRIRLVPSDWTLERNGGTITVESKEGGWINTGDEPWPAMWSTFLSTEEVPGGRLIAFSPIDGAPRIQATSDRLRVRIRLTF